jgi:hypothetical protein
MRYFANDNERVTTVMLPGDRTFPQSIGDASVQTGFYTVIDQAGQQSDAVEQALSLVEADAATAWREVAAGVWPLDDEHRGSVAAWVALQLLRGSSVRNSMSELASHTLLLEMILGGRTRLREPEGVDSSRGHLRGHALRPGGCRLRLRVANCCCCGRARRFRRSAEDPGARTISIDRCVVRSQWAAPCE